MVKFFAAVFVLFATCAQANQIRIKDLVEFDGVRGTILSVTDWLLA